jgi:cold shock CspA family protein
MVNTEQTTEVQGEEKYGEHTYTARVKWFNRTAGWGFVSLTKGAEEHENDDIFIHWKSLNVENEQYKYLVNGEYVNLKINYTASGEHSYQANSVTGIDGGPLMCETRNTENDSRRGGDDGGDHDSQPRQQRPRQSRGSRGPRGPREGEVWQLVHGGDGRGRSNRGGGQNRQRFNRDHNREQEHERE